MFSCLTYACVRDGKLEPRVRKYIFLGYASGVKGYRLWCNNPKSLGLIIDRDVTFNESASLDSQKEKSIAESDYGIREQVEFKIDTLAVQSNDSKDKVQDPYHDKISQVGSALDLGRHKTPKSM